MVKKKRTSEREVLARNIRFLFKSRPISDLQTFDGIAAGKSPEGELLQQRVNRRASNQIGHDFTDCRSQHESVSTEASCQVKAAETAYPAQNRTVVGRGIVVSGNDSSHRKTRHRGQQRGAAGQGLFRKRQVVAILSLA